MVKIKQVKQNEVNIFYKWVHWNKASGPNRLVRICCIRYIERCWDDRLGFI